MAVERQAQDPTRELRLEGIGLLFGGGVLLALIVGAFFLGRWVERRGPAPELLAAGGAGPLSQLTPLEPRREAAAGQDYFDKLAGDPRRIEPAREVAVRSTAEREAGAAAPRATAPQGAAQPATPEAAAAPGAGAFYVQVLAVRDRVAAAELVERLQQQGYGVRLFSEREGEGLLYKVRVGGYGTRQQAGVARDALRSAGHPGAFVWPAG